MRYLVLGGSGFIGKNLLQEWSDRDVIAPTSKELNLLDFGAVQRFLSATEPDVVIHSACRPGHRNAPIDPNGVRDNIRLVANVAANLRPAMRMVWIGTGGAYGVSNYRPMMTEASAHAVVPTDDTGVSRFAISMMLRTHSNIVELRPFSVYGPHEDWEIRFISNAIAKALLGMPITIKQDRLFSFIHVADVIGAVDEVVKMWPTVNQMFNVCPDSPSLLTDIAGIIREQLSITSAIHIKKDGLDVEYSGSNLLFRQTFPSWTYRRLDEGIAILMEWFRARALTLPKELLLHDK